ncbi:MAG: hypothetical protein ACKPBU_07145, partial [Alphaproteobacteria bacterium]
FGESLFLFHSHNLAIDALTGCGLAGGVAAAWLAWRLVGTMRRAWRGVGLTRVEAVSLAASIGVFLALCLVDMPFYHGRLTFLFVIAWAWTERRLESASAEVRADAAGELDREALPLAAGTAARASVPRPGGALACLDLRAAGQTGP